MRLYREVNYIKLFLEDGSPNIEVINSVLDKQNEFFQEAYKFLRPSSDINVSKSDFNNFFSLQKRIILNWNKKKTMPQKKDYLLFEKVLTVLFDKNCWEEESFHYQTDVSRGIVLLFLNVLPKDFLIKLRLKASIIEMINIEIYENWVINEVYKIEQKLNSMLNNHTINKLGFLTADVLFKSFEIKSKSKLKSFTKKYKRLAFVEDLTKLFNNEILFWDILTIRGNYNISPNKKYTVEMFNITTEYIQKGYKEYVAFSETLTQFYFDPLKDDSYRKAYKTYLKNK